MSMQTATEAMSEMRTGFSTHSTSACCTRRLAFALSAWRCVASVRSVAAPVKLAPIS